MKNFIQLFALLVLFTFTSCTIENDSYDVINEQASSIAINSYKTATITYDSNIDVKVLDELKVELKVQKIVKLTNNEEVWVMNNSDDTHYIEEFVLFSDGILGVEVVEGESILNVEGKDGDTKGEDSTTGEDEKDGDTKGEDSTTGEDE